MARTEKKTKIKGLPPRVLLSERDAVTGSYPLVIHGQLGGFPGLAPFNDTNTLNLTQSNIYYGLGVPTSSIYIPSLLNLTTSLTGSGRVVAGISDTFLSIPQYRGSSSFVPFKDNDQFAAVEKGFSDPFWATGSNIEGFTAPIWSKNKIEIDFTPLTASSLTGSRGQQSSSYMGYYNFSLRKWTPLRPAGIIGGRFDPGSEARVGGGVDYSQQLWGFSASHNKHYSIGIGNDWKFLLNHGRPISTFGFPFSGIFEATSSNLIPMSGFIDRPFVVEKIMVIMSASFRLSTLPGTLDDAFDLNGDPFYTTDFGVSSSYVINNFFLLNQRKSATPGVDLSLNDPTYVVNRHLVFSRSNTIRDLIGWFEIASFNNDYGYVASASLFPQYFYRDATIINSGSTASTTSSWNRMLVMSNSAKNPKATALAETEVFGALSQNTTVQISLWDKSFAEFLNAGWWGGRGGLGAINVSGRDLLNAATQFDGDKEAGADYSLQIGQGKNDWSKDNPYILQPTDALILGWQLPTHDDLGGALNSSELYPTGSFVEFPIAPAKIILYGSFLSEGKTINDTLNQVLVSNSIHEAIE